ncbi:hypothetical protein, partial [Deinococcus soli (ex Cha et al. 2016)]
MPRFLLRDLKGLGFILLVVYAALSRDLLPRAVWISLNIPSGVALVAAGLWLIWMGLRARPEQWTGTWPLEDGVVSGHRVVQGFGLGWWLRTSNKTCERWGRALKRAIQCAAWPACRSSRS